jgi:P-type Ca2+ transporter type 2C
MELLIDPACSVAFEAEPEEPDIMTRPPRPAGASPFSRENLFEGVLQGIGVATILIGGYTAMQFKGFAAEQSHGAVFIALLLSVMQLTLNNRSRSIGLVAAFSRNPWFPRMTLAVFVALTLAVVLPPIRRILGMGLPDAVSIACAVLMSAVVLLWLQALRSGMMRWRAAKLPY